MDLLIFTSSLGHSKCIDDKLFVRSTINKFHPHITIYFLGKQKNSQNLNTFK